MTDVWYPTFHRIKGNYKISTTHFHQLLLKTNDGSKKRTAGRSFFISNGQGFAETVEVLCLNRRLQHSPVPASERCCRSGRRR